MYFPKIKKLSENKRNKSKKVFVFPSSIVFPFKEMLIFSFLHFLDALPRRPLNTNISGRFKEASDTIQESPLHSTNISQSIYF